MNRPPMIRHDRANHYIYGLAVSMCMQLICAGFYGASYVEAYRVGTISGILAGWLWEKLSGGQKSGADLAWTSGGAATPELHSMLLEAIIAS